MGQHFLYKNPIPFCGIVDQHMRDRTCQLSVLDNGAAAHTLNDPARQRQKLLIHHADHNPPVNIFLIQIDFHYLDRKSVV